MPQVMPTMAPAEVRKLSSRLTPTLNSPSTTGQEVTTRRRDCSSDVSSGGTITEHASGDRRTVCSAGLDPARSCRAAGPLAGVLEREEDVGWARELGDRSQAGAETPQ